MPTPKDPLYSKVRRAVARARAATPAPAPAPVDPDVEPPPPAPVPAPAPPDPQPDPPDAIPEDNISDINPTGNGEKEIIPDIVEKDQRRDLLGRFLRR